ncbi:hypothetical protein N7519_007362 [Penicillium mononematosum]|uniref:uncharacterized protein n=1 Tax=Penicillium mononematosum TaxID=268346 RepID=UPI002548F56B|nr:uncharacterized protein N7519_007362 [Penicillium mononematosum]KAJ6186061.1 hypothetical protein N7519_007362 [Penicillium mononematosum]
MPAVLIQPMIVVADDFGKGNWFSSDGVEAHKMGTSSVIAIANEEGFLLSNASSDSSKDIDAAYELCTRYEENKPLFCNKPVTVWIVYEQGNERGSSIRGIMRGIQPAPARIVEQKYYGESFMNYPTDEGALFRLELVGRTLRATMCRQDGHGSPVAVTDNGPTLVHGQ